MPTPLCRKVAGDWQYLVRLAGTSCAEGLLSIGQLLAWALPRLADAAADAGHAVAAAVLPLLQACLRVRDWGSTADDCTSMALMAAALAACRPARPVLIEAL